MDLITHCRRLREIGNTELIDYERNFYIDGDLTSFIQGVRKYYEKNFLLELLKNYSLRETIKSITGLDLREKDISQYETIISDHIKSLGTEITLKYATEKFDLLYLIAEKYDFEVAQKRSKLIDKLIEAIKKRSDKRINTICHEYNEIIFENRQLIQKFYNSTVVDYSKVSKMN